MYKRLVPFFTVWCFCIFLTACGPSDEKVAQAQQKYSQLAELNDQAVAAHKGIDDDSMDESLIGLYKQVSELGEYNLLEMEDEEIDVLIESMDILIDSYEEFLESLSQIKGKEDAAVVEPIPLTVSNNTDFTFSAFRLYEKGDHSANVNVLEDFEPLSPGQTLAGLVISRGVDNTPWILALEDTDGGEYELELPVKEYDEAGMRLNLIFDAESGELSAEHDE